MQLVHRSRPIHILSRSMPNLNSILWCPPDDRVFDAAKEFLNEQYDREIQEFYLNARDQALARRGTAQHVHEEHQVVPD